MNQFEKDNRYIKIINELVSGRMIDQYEFKDLIEMVKNLSKVGGHHEGSCRAQKGDCVRVGRK